MTKKRTEEDFEQAAFHLIRSAGFFLPESEAEVAATECVLEDLPEGLRDPYAVFEPRREPCPPSSQTDEPETVQDCLARAARGSGLITPEIEALMRLDRERAERDANGAGDE